MEDFKSWGKKILKLTYQIFQAKNLQNLTLLDLIRSMESFTPIANSDLAQSEDQIGSIHYYKHQPIYNGLLG